MKISNFTWLGRAVKSTATAAILLGILIPPSQNGTVSASAATNSKAEQILNSLTQEQRDALTKMEATENYGLQGFNEKDLKSDKETSVIVEFNSKPEEPAILEAAIKGKKLTNAEAKRNIDREHDSFSTDLKKIMPASKEKSGKSPYKIMRSFKTAYNGVSIKLPANEVKSLLQSDAVKAVYKSATFTVEPPVISDTTGEKDSTRNIESIPFLGVDKLHEEGFTGKGVKVGVIDTGIDYNHPDLKGAYKGGYDFVDNDNDPMETTYDDWVKSGSKPPTEGQGAYYTEHGTHVSGTIAGQAKNTGGVAVEGIAPDADLYVYRVLGPYGTGVLDTILAGIDKAVSDGMDVINLSLGTNINDPFYPTSTAINYAVLSGVTAVVSAGNTGPSSYTLGTPGTAALALTVGASSTPISIAKYTGVLSGDSNKTYDLSNLYSNFTEDLRSFDKQTLEIVDLGVGNVNDYTNKDVTGKIALVSTGVIGTQNKVVYAKDHGAIAVLNYNNIPNAGPLEYVRDEQNFVPTFSLSYEQGLDLITQLAAGNNKMTFNNFKEEYTKGDELAYFSSRGPSRKNYDIKPEITAPGVSVLSSVPAYAIWRNDSTNYKYAYNRMSGTSMAAPHVTGIAALLLQANPNLQPGDIKTILMNTAKPMDESNSVFDVGAGRVDPYRAIHTGMMLQVQDETPIPVNGKVVMMKDQTGGISFGSQYADSKQTITKKLTFQNLDNETKTFKVAVKFKTGANGSLDAKANGVKLDVAPLVEVDGKKSVPVNTTLKIPNSANQGIYEGDLVVTNTTDKKDQYRIPFGVRVTGEGFNSTSLSSNAISPPHLHVKRSFNTTTSVALNFNLKAPMKKLDLVLEDGKTGQDIGFLETIPMEDSYDNTNYFISNVFDGTYYAFTGKPDKPISTIRSYAKPGHYQIKAIGTSERNHTFTTYNDVYIDNNSPDISTNLDQNESPVIEYQPGQKSVPLQVKVKDEDVEKLMVSGLNINQSVNKLNYSINGNFNPVLPVGADGTVNLDVPMNESNPFLRFTLNGLDWAQNTSDKKNYYFVKAGTPYGYIKTDKTTIKMGETISTTLVLNNIDKLKSAEWTLSNIGQSLEIIDAKPNNALANYGTAGVTVETIGNNSIVKLMMDGTKSVTGNIPAINLTLKAKDTAFAVSAAINPTVAYSNELGNRISISSAGMEWQLQPTFSELYGTLKASGIAYNADWTKLGASIQLIDANGKKYDGTSSIISYGDYRISKLPVTDKPFSWEFKLPGHFMMKIQLPIGVEKNGIIWGQLRQYISEFAVAGDVNQDDVIDVMDALYIQTYWGTNKRAADINFDGVVDAKDLTYVEQNYLMQNPTNSNSPTPKKKYKSQTLETVKSELGIQ
ncbi:S8 family serine peptidase [Bacillus sp. AFS017336]|uniref:S8 family serine peptidase n=1 Tax=Bacillus sp. AFS017336 TaxID=2033489 RepID=UPI000BF02BBE|nr:S8 family serine peptidase [Bacillus sp. AFS017336]PEL08384.1 hypothetical protein CN601_16830 [Bacillus sp. AFS017336]